jgi:hypothetical protein
VLKKTDECQAAMPTSTPTNITTTLYPRIDPLS